METKKLGGRKKRVSKEDTTQNGSPLDHIRQQERVEIIAEELLKMKSKVKIQKEYMAKWGCSRPTINTIIDEAMCWILEIDKTDREQIRALNANRIDYLFDEANGVRDKARLIDLLNKMYGVYETNVNINTGEDAEFTFSFGEKDKDKEGDADNV